MDMDIDMEKLNGEVKVKLIKKKSKWESKYGAKVAVLTSDEWESAKWLAKAIDAYVVKYPGSSYDIVIRYGNRTKVGDAVVINNTDAVEYCVNRKLFAEKMKKCGVRTPYIVSWLDKLRYASKYPKYVYIDGKSQAGKGVVIVQSKSDEQWLKTKGYNWVESRWVSVDREYRVHVINVGKRYKWLLQLKVPTKVSQMMFLVRNKALTGYEFRHVSEAQVGWLEKRVVREAMKAVREISLDFGAVDVIVSGSDVYVVDVNSAPGILRYPYLREFYRSSIQERVKYEIGIMD